MIRERITPLLAVMVVAAAALVGCGVDDPYSEPPGTTTVDDAARHTDAAPAEDTATGAITPPLPEVERRDPRIRVAVDFAVTQATWSGDTWAAQQARMKRLAAGRALRELEETDLPIADQAKAIAESKMTSRATFLAADIRKGRDSQTDATVIVVLKVEAGGAGRRDDVPDYTVNQATLRNTDAGWRVTNYLTLP